MKLIQAFFYIYYKSISSIAYYAEVLKTSLGFSLKYLLVLGVLFSTLSTAKFYINTFPQVKEVLNSIPAEVATIYPDDLVITGKDNEWFINKPEPYAIEVPAKWLEFLHSGTTKSSERFPKNLVVFDKAGMVDKFHDYDTAVLVTKNSFVYMEDTDGSVKFESMDTVPNGMIDKAKVTELTGMVETQLNMYVKYIPFFVGILILLVNTTGKLLYLIFIALILMGTGTALKKRITYTQGYKLGIHAITLPWTVQFIASFAGIQIPVSMWFSFMTLAIGAAAIYRIPALETPTTPQAQV